MSKEGKTGVTTNTPNNVLFGAGTIHKGLKYSGDSWNFLESLVGATNGGNKLSIVPEVTTVEVDGADVAVKGLKVKTGETATMEINFAELTEEIIKNAIFAKGGTSTDSQYDLIESKANIEEEGDYWENVAFVGRKLDGTNVIVILDNALCTSGLEIDAAKKEGATVPVTFECHADIESDLDTLPYHIYYPKATA